MLRSLQLHSVTDTLTAGRGGAYLEGTAEGALFVS